MCDRTTGCVTGVLPNYRVCCRTNRCSTGVNDRLRYRTTGCDTGVLPGDRAGYWCGPGRPGVLKNARVCYRMTGCVTGVLWCEVCDVFVMSGVCLVVCAAWCVMWMCNV